MNVTSAYTSTPVIRKMTSFQYGIVLLCFIMNMCDGMNVMTISYVANNIGRQWSVMPGALGWVFSAGLLGMALGAMLLAPRADVIGRKSLILISVAWMGLGVFLTGFSSSLPLLIVFRFFTGIGIGSMLACTSTLVAEYAPAESKSFWVSFVMAGYPAGAVLSGIVANYIIAQQGWNALFFWTGAVTLLTLPFMYYFLKESLEFLFTRQPRNALKRANDILEAIGSETLARLPEKGHKKQLPSVERLFTHHLLRSTVLLWLAFFLSFAALYFLTSWIPKLASVAGMSTSLSIYAGVLFNLGALFGIVLQGYLSAKLGLRNIICCFLVATALLMVLFGMVHGSIILLALFCFTGLVYKVDLLVCMRWRPSCMKQKYAAPEWVGQLGSAGWGRLRGHFLGACF